MSTLFFSRFPNLCISFIEQTPRQRGFQIYSRTHHGHIGAFLWPKECCHRHQDSRIHCGCQKFVPPASPRIHWQRSFPHSNCWRHNQTALCHWVVAIGKAIGVVTAFLVCQFARDPTAETDYGPQTIWCESCVPRLRFLYDISQ